MSQQQPSFAYPRTSKGKRPVFFKDPSVDHLMTMVLELAAELSVVYTRLDTVERMLTETGQFDRAKIDSWQPTDAAEAERAQWRQQFLENLFRTVLADQGRGDEAAGE